MISALGWFPGIQQSASEVFESYELRESPNHASMVSVVMDSSLC
jgi:hypothetical protein